MNYKDLQNISSISHQILSEAANEVHDPMNRWPYTSPYLQEAKDGWGDDSKFNRPDDMIKKPGTEVPPPKPGGYGRISRSIPYGIGAHANRTASRVTTIIGNDPGAPRSEKMAKDEKPKTRKLTKKGGKWTVGEDFDLYDLVMFHLLDEGYASTEEAATAIMSNMSEEWVDDIIESEGSYGQTPKAHAAFNTLRLKREKTPDSKFSGSGGKSAAVARARKHTASSGGHYSEPGKKSPRPDDYTIRQGMTQSDRDAARQQRRYDEEDIDNYMEPDPRGPKGSLPKGKKLARQRKRGVSA